MSKIDLEIDMSSAQKKEKILAMAQANGCPVGLYAAEASELAAAGLIKIATVRSAVGAFKSVWVIA